ncbi:MAG: hypothetical protein JO091_09445, partial [Acidobacteriaceae bacterium]|nr:hypothetical protein [Acidobacteriaceae bacterium]
MSRFYLGVDGGQSSTVALIANEDGRVIGRGSGGACNHVGSSEGRDKFLSAVGECLEQACAAAGINRHSTVFAAACFGFSGGAEDKEAYTRELVRSEKYRITHDADIALAGATAGEPGIVVIAGTGSMAFGRNAAGNTARAGGWGYVFGDEGGAFDLTRRALRAALRYEEGWGPGTALRALLIESTGAEDANALLHRFYTDKYSRARIAQYAPLVSEAAEGDAVARAILAEAADKLALLAKGVFQQLFRPGEKTTVAFTGGVFDS